MVKYLINCFYETNGNISTKDYWFDDLDKAIDYIKSCKCYQWTMKKLFVVERSCHD